LTAPRHLEHHPEASTKGFIVHPTWRVHADATEIHLYGRLDTGETFLAIDTRTRPGCYLRTSELAGGRQITRRFGDTFTPTDLRTMDGETVERVSVSSPRKLGPMRRALAEGGVRTYEADVPFAWAYLIDRHLRCGVEIRGPWSDGTGIDRIYRNPDATPCDMEPRLVVASVALALHPQTGVVQAAAVAGSDARTAQETDVVLSLAAGESPPAARLFPTERDLLRALCETLRTLDPDVVTGWDVVSHVLAPLKARMVRCGIPFNLGRSNRLSRVTPQAPPSRRRTAPQAILEGRQILDARTIVRCGQRRFADLELATVAREVLGGTPRSVGERARAVLDILEADDLLRLSVQRSLLIGVPLQRAWTSVQSFDFLYLSELHARGIVAPTRDVDRLGGSPAPGGLILTPRAGEARNVLVLDFQSLYPSIIRTFNIDPAAQRADPVEGQDVIIAPNGAVFSRSPGILPKILDRFFDSRSRAKARGDRVASYAYKIIMNSFYGVLGTSSCRFASQSISGAITSFGQHLLRWTRDLLMEEGLTVLYGDTDSLFVDAGTALPAGAPPEAAAAYGRNLASFVNKRLAESLASTYRVESRLKLEMEKVYTRFFLPTVRGDDRGRAKGYAGLIVGPAGDHVDIVGMEAVRRDWTAVARRFQRELLDLAFHDASGQQVEDYVAKTLRTLRSGQLDGEIVYQRSLRKPVAEYTKTQPPHVQAASLLAEEKQPGDVVRYAITVRGPRPVERLDAPIDYGHIIRKQLLPIARTLAPLLHIPEDLFGNGQLGLF